MGTYVNGMYLPALAETGWEDEVNDNFRRLGDVGVNVKAFGAVGDGVADDTDAIWACIEATKRYDIGITPSTPTIPDALKGGIGGAVFFPPGVYCFDETLEPVFSGGTEAGSSARKTLNFVGSGYWQTTLRWTGAAGGTMMRLGTNGIGGNAANSDNQGAIISGLGFNGGGLASTGLDLVECSLFRVERCAFGGLRDYGIISQPASGSGNDYGSIDLVIRECYFGEPGPSGSGIGAAAGVSNGIGVGIKCIDPHAITIDNCEFIHCRHGNIWLTGGGGNMYRITNNSLEGMNQSAQTDSGGPYHSVLIDINYGLIQGNAWEDVFTSAPDCRLIKFGSGASYALITGNLMGVNPGDYAIEFTAAHFSGIWMVANPQLFGQVGAVKCPSGFGTDLYASSNGNWVNPSDPDGRILIGPGYDFTGFSKMVVGAHATVLASPGLRYGSTFDVRGIAVADTFAGTEVTTPSNPPNNTGKLYFRDNGSGKTQLCVMFDDTVPIVLATEA